MMSQNQRPVECRACLSSIDERFGYKNSQNIFLPWSAPWSQFGSTIAVDLARVSNVEITDIEDYPHLMCESCCTKLYNACEFIDRVQKTDEILKDRSLQKPLTKSVISPKLHKKSVISPKPLAKSVISPKPVTKSPIISNSDGKQVEWPKPIQVEKSVNSEMYRGDFDIEIKQEVLSDAEIPDFGNNSPEECQDEQKKVVFVVKTSKSKAKTNGAVKKAKNPSKKQVYENEEYLDYPLKDEPRSDMELTLDIPLDCMLCSKTLQSVSGLKAHVMACHNYKTVKRKAASAISNVPPKKPAGKHTCATCRRSFSTPTDLMVHETCHNQSVCYGCNHKFDSFDKLTKHRRRCKAANTQAPRVRTLQDAIRPPRKAPLKCASCDEIFSDEYYMNIHNEIHHNSQAKSEVKHVEGDKKRKKSKDKKEEKSIDRKVIEIEILENILEENSTDKALKIGAPIKDSKNNSETKIIENILEENSTDKALKIGAPIKDSKNNSETKIIENILEENSTDTKAVKTVPKEVIKKSKSKSKLVEKKLNVIEECTSQPVQAKDSDKNENDEVDNGGMKDSNIVESKNANHDVECVESVVVEKNTGDKSMSVDNHENVEPVDMLGKNTEDGSKITVDNQDENLKTSQLESLEIKKPQVDTNSKLDGLTLKHVKESDTMEVDAYESNTEGNDDKQSVNDIDLQNSEENQVKTTDNNIEEDSDIVHTDTVHTENQENDSVNAEVQELENRETNQSTEVDKYVNTEVKNLSVNTEVNNTANKENHLEEIIPENTEDGSLNTEVIDIANKKMNESEAIIPEHTENIDDLDLCLHNLAENIQNNIQDSDSIQMDNINTFTDNVDVFEENSKLIGNVQNMDSNVQTDIDVGDTKNTENKTYICINTVNTENKPYICIETKTNIGLQETTENNKMAEDIVIEDNTEKSIDIDKFIKVNITVESDIEQMDTQENSNNKIEQEIYPNTEQIKTIDSSTMKVYNIKTLNPEQINQTVFTKLDEKIAPTNIDTEILPTVMEDDG